jgi:hypothetical protein
VSVLRGLVQTVHDLLIPSTTVVVGVETSDLHGVRSSRPTKPLTGIGMITRPAVLLTADGAILCWYLPGMLQSSRKQELLDAAKCLTKTAPSTAANGSKRAQKGNSWRIAAKNFPSGVGTLEGVALNLSPGYFNNAHVSPCVGTILSCR